MRFQVEKGQCEVCTIKSKAALRSVGRGGRGVPGARLPRRQLGSKQLPTALMAPTAPMQLLPLDVCISIPSISHPNQCFLLSAQN